MEALQNVINRGWVAERVADCVEGYAPLYSRVNEARLLCAHVRWTHFLDVCT